MKIHKVESNNRKKCFMITTAKASFEFPYVKLTIRPTENDPVIRVFADPELNKEGFTYLLASGKEGTVLIDQVLEYNQDADYMRKMLLYKLSIKAQELLKKNKSSKRAVMRRMKTSPTQFYRLMDQTNYHKSIDQMTRLLSALDCHVDIIFKKAA